MNTRVGAAMVPHLSIDQQIQMAILLEKLGFDSLWWPDHLLYTDQAVGIDCWTVMAAVAARTRRIALATGVSDPHRVHPAVFAQRAATLDQLSRGRLLLGLGSGESMNLDPFGIPWQDRKVGRLREFIQVVRALLDSRAPLNHEGPLFRMRNAALSVRPYRDRHIPIYLAALGPQMQKLAGQLADGWIPVCIPSEHYGNYFEPIADAARSASRDPAGLDRAAQIVLAIVPEGRKLSSAEIGDCLRPFAAALVWGVCARQMGLPFEPPAHLAEVGYQTVNPCDPESMRLYKEYSQWMPAETMARFVLVGTAREILASLRAYQQAGVTHFYLINGSPDPLPSWLTIACDIVPALTGRPAPVTARALDLAVRPLQRLGLTRKLVPNDLDVWKPLGL